MGDFRMRRERRELNLNQNIILFRDVKLGNNIREKTIEDIA